MARRNSMLESARIAGRTLFAHQPVSQNKQPWFPVRYPEVSSITRPTLGREISCLTTCSASVPPLSPPCLGLCRAHGQVLGSVAAGALVPAVKPRWCCRGLLLLKDDGGDWRKSAGSPLNNVVCHLPSMVVRQRPGRRCRIADLPRPTGLTSPGKCLFGRMGVWSGLWPSAACRGQYIWRLPRLEKAAGSGSADWRWHEIRGLLGVSTFERRTVVCWEVLGGLAASAIN